MTTIALHRTRGPLVESAHDVHLALADASGSRLGAWGDVDLPVFWRSAAKPFQALASVRAGVLQKTTLPGEALALACGSHSSEPKHRAVAGAMLAALGLDERALACGVHAPLGVEMDARVRLGMDLPSPVWSNCSGKHALMLGLAHVEGWHLDGYAREGHPVQTRILEVIAEVTGVEPAAMPIGLDGCNAVCTAVPLNAMARAWAGLAEGSEPAQAQIRDAMLADPEMVAGAKRLCTALMRAADGRLVVKVGAEGVYCAGLVHEGIGVALKVRDGSMTHAGVALLGVLRLLDEAHGLGLAEALDQVDVRMHGPGVIRNTRGERTGEQRLMIEAREFATVLRAPDHAPAVAED